MKIKLKKNLIEVLTIAIIILIVLVVYYLPTIRSSINQVLYDDFIDRIRSDALSASIKITQIKHKNHANGTSVSVSAGASGVIFYKDKNTYYALTAEHVIAESDDADKTQIIAMGYDDLDLTDAISKGGKFQSVANYYQQFPEAVVVYANDQYDLAVVRFTTDADYAVLSISEKPPEFGDTVASMGNPNRRRNIITVGKVNSRKPEPFGRGAGNMQYPVITHTSVISMGNSGGALLNENLEIVGINLGGRENIFRQYRSGIAIPSNFILEFLQEWEH